MRFHFGYAKAEVEAMPWYDAEAHREYMFEARAAAQASPWEAPPSRRWTPDEALPVEDGRPQPWNPDASPVPTAASRPRPTARPTTFTAQELGLEPGTQVSEQDGDAATLRADGFTVLPWTGN